MTTTADAPPAAITAWFEARLPEPWRAAPPEITVDREEITVVLTVDAPEVGDDDPAVVAQAIAGRTAGFRDETRDARIAVAREAEHRFERKVAWGVRVGDTTTVFTHLAVPVMTRLRQRERLVLDTLASGLLAHLRPDDVADAVSLAPGRSADA